MLIWLVFSGRGKIGELIGAMKKTPKEFDAGKKRVEDPAGAARDVTPPKDPAG